MKKVMENLVDIENWLNSLGGSWNLYGRVDRGKFLIKQAKEAIQLESERAPCVKNVETVAFIKDKKIIGEFPLNPLSHFGDREAIGLSNGLTDWDYHGIRINGKFILTKEGLIMAQTRKAWDLVVFLDEGFNEVQKK